MYRRRAGPRELRRLPEGWTPAKFTRFDLVPQSPTIGAEVQGIDLRAPLDDALFAELDRALLEWKVLFFRDQDLSVQQHAAFAGRWGELTDDQLVPTPRRNPVDNVVLYTRDADTPGLENEWHMDGTFRERPTVATVLRAVEVPESGGDTLFADMGAAWDTLSEELRERVRPLTAVHDWSLGSYADKYADRIDELRAAVPPAEHPIAATHPVTGRTTLFVNRLFTNYIPGLSRADSDELLDLLCRQTDLPELQCRFRWRPGSIAFWDNFAVQHYGANDYFPKRRTMVRATISARWDCQPS